MAALSLLLGMVLTGPAASAHAPALATVTAEVSLLVAPSPDAPVLALLPVGTEMQLTGAAGGAFLEVTGHGQTGWAAASSLNGGIATAFVVLDVDLRAAPNGDGAIVGTVPGGNTVILTGAEVDGFVAAAFSGTGGWLPAAALGID